MSTEERQYLDRLIIVSEPLARARDLALRFAAIVHERTSGDLDNWLADAAESELRSFANGLKQDKAAVQAALNYPGAMDRPRGKSPGSS